MFFLCLYECNQRHLRKLKMFSISGLPEDGFKWNRVLCLNNEYLSKVLRHTFFELLKHLARLLPQPEMKNSFMVGLFYEHQWSNKYSI